MRIGTWCASSIAFAGLLISTLGAAETKPLDPAKMDPAAMEKMMQEFAKLAPQHEVFQRMAGSWTTEVKNFEPNSTEPTVSNGTAEFKCLMGGRYLMQSFQSDMNGQEYEGIGISGFDKGKQRYVGVWFDNMSTGLVHTQGTFDAARDTMTETGSANTPMGAMDMRMVTQHLDKDSFRFSLFMKLPDGNEMKSMEIIYRRK
jgi:hypothetical protein